jgi:hypothetical protein
MCAANYPPEMEGRACPQCNERLYLQPEEEPDPDLLHYAEQSRPLLEPGPGSSKGSVVRVEERDGLFWISDASLKENGYFGLTTFERIEIEGLLYEIQGFKASSAEWWVELVAAEKPSR